MFYNAVQDDLEVLLTLPQPPKYWDYAEVCHHSQLSSPNSEFILKKAMNDPL